MLSAMDRSAAPPAGAPLKRKIAAILAADVAGYSRLVALDEEGTLRILAAAREIFDGLVHRAGGRIFNTAGDSVMCEFDSAVEAVRVAIDIQDSLASAGAGIAPDRRIEFRIGITIGDVVERGDDLLGDGVNIAARLESISPPGGVCISRSVHESVANKIPVVFDDIGPRQLKNLPQPIHAFVISRRLEPLGGADRIVVEPRPEQSAAATAREGRYGTFVALGFLLAAGAVAIPGIPMVMRAMNSADAPRTATPAKPPSNLASSTPVEVVTPQKPPQPANKVQPQPQPKPPARAAEKAPEKPAATEKAAVAEKAAPEERPQAAPPIKPVSPAEAASTFAALSREGLIQDPKTVPELYHDARFLEAKGDREAALRAYAAAAPHAGGALDLLMRYAGLVRAVHGAEAARKAVQELARGTSTKPVGLVMAMQADGADRRAKLDAMASDNPDDLPAAYFLADALMERRQGGPTLTDRRLAFAALDRFIEGAEVGALAPLFMDEAFLDGWVEAARARRADIEANFASASARPSASFTRSDSGWVARVTLPEPAAQVSARIGETGETVSAPASTGRPMTSAEITLPAALGRTTLYLTYRDLSGREAGPFPVPFDPETVLVSSGRETLERNPDSWVSFRPDLPDVLSYAQLVANRCAIKQALIGLGTDAPSQPLPMPGCQTGSSGTAPNTRSVISLPDGTDSVQVKLAYADGTESEIRTFRRP